MELLHIKGSDEKMRIKQFDVVKLKNKKEVIIKKVYKRKKYLIEIINDEGTKIEQQIISYKDIDDVIYSKKKNNRY